MGEGGREGQRVKKDMEGIIDEWLAALPPFVSRHYYFKKKFLKEVFIHICDNIFFFYFVDLHFFFFFSSSSD